MYMMYTKHKALFLRSSNATSINRGLQADSGSNFNCRVRSHETNKRKEHYVNGWEIMVFFSYIYSSVVMSPGPL